MNLLYAFLLWLMGGLATPVQPGTAGDQSSAAAVDGGSQGNGGAKGSSISNGF